MARKSQERRISEAKATLAMWKQGGHEGERAALFIRDMIANMERGKYPTTGQRKWLDELIDMGTSAFPKVHNQDRLDEIDSAINTKGMGRIDVLRDFRYKLKKGWTLSDKQEKWLVAMLEEARELRETGIVFLGEDDQALVESLLTHCELGTNDYYGYNSGKKRFCNEVRSFISEHGGSTTKHLDTLKKLFKGVTKALTENRYPVGSLCSAYGVNGMVMGEPYVCKSSGIVKIDVMANAKVKAVGYDSLRKRLAKEGTKSRFWEQ